MYNNAIKKQKNPVQAKKPVVKVSEQESKDVMNQLFDDLDNNEDLNEH